MLQSELVHALASRGVRYIGPTWFYTRGKWTKGFDLEWRGKCMQLTMRQIRKMVVR